MLSLEDIMLGFIKSIFKFFGRIFIDIIWDLYIDPFVYSTGKITLKILTLGFCSLNHPSKPIKFMIYLTGAIILFAGWYLIFYAIQYFFG